MELDARMAIQIGAVIASLAGAWGLVRNQVASLKQRQEEQRRKFDGVENTVAVLRSQITVLSNILSPSNLEEQNKWRGFVSERLKKTEAEITSLQKMHNGRHPSVDK